MKRYDPGFPAHGGTNVPGRRLSWRAWPGPGWVAGTDARQPGHPDGATGPPAGDVPTVAHLRLPALAVSGRRGAGPARARADGRDVRRVRLGRPPAVPHGGRTP